jgi:hypothetical protein
MIVKWLFGSGEEKPVEKNDRLSVYPLVISVRQGFALRQMYCEGPGELPQGVPFRVIQTRAKRPITGL